MFRKQSYCGLLIAVGRRVFFSAFRRSSKCRVKSNDSEETCDHTVTYDHAPPDRTVTTYDCARRDRTVTYTRTQHLVTEVEGNGNALELYSYFWIQKQNIGLPCASSSPPDSRSPPVVLPSNESGPAVQSCAQTNGSALVPSSSLVGGGALVPGLALTSVPVSSTKAGG